DGVFTSAAISPWSRYLARWFARRRLTPDAVTWLALLTALATAAAFGTGVRVWMVVGALLLELSFALDCVDGQLARYAVSYSERGAWLDAALDRLKEFVVYGGLAYGAARQGHDVWLLATLCIALQTARHVADFGFHRSAVDRARPAPEPGPGPAPEPTAAAAVADGTRVDESAPEELFSGRMASTRGVALRRVLALPIGERWLLIAVLAAVTNARVVFVALLVLGLLAAAWTVGGRLLRAQRRPAPGESAAQSIAAVLASMADLAPTGPRLPGGAALVRWWWLAPAALRAVEYAAVGLLGVLLARDPGGRHAPAAAFVLVLVLAQRHYDVVYRLTAAPRLPVWPPQAATLGVVGRLALVWVAAFGGGRLGVTALVALTAWVAACVVAGASRRFRETAPRRRPVVRPVVRPGSARTARATADSGSHVRTVRPHSDMHVSNTRDSDE
ncbi:MAG: CDP-alcohol phosphatidyltransferase family protein, partial [Actinomycetes bacterium]